jgi:hypothetical protein
VMKTVEKGQEGLQVRTGSGQVREFRLSARSARFLDFTMADNCWKVEVGLIAPVLLQARSLRKHIRWAVKVGFCARMQDSIIFIQGICL